MRLAKALPLLLFSILLCSHGQKSGTSQVATPKAPIIDMHLHAMSVDDEGPPPLFICAPFDYWPAWDTRQDHGDYEPSVDKHPPCAHPLKTPDSNADLMNRTLKIMRERNVIGVASGDQVERWKEAGGDRILRAVYFNPASGKPSVSDLRKLAQSTKITAFSEIVTQYGGMAPNDPKLEPYYALAEELDIPVGIHIGPGPPGIPYFSGGTPYRMRDSSMLLLEDVLARQPKMRLWAMHAGWPLGDDAVAALYAHPQLYVDVGILSYAFPHKEFYAYMQRLIDAGFENRIMFGSDEMVWPDALSAAIDNVQADPALSAKQKRDIFYNNAARFLRLP